MSWFTQGSMPPMMGPVASAPMTEALHKMGLVPVGGTPAEFHKKVLSDRARWAPVIKESGIKMDA